VDVALVEDHVSQGEPDRRAKGTGPVRACRWTLLHSRRAGHGVGGRSEDGQHAVAEALDLPTASLIDGLAPSPPIPSVPALRDGPV
jgi:hypothetical protein